MAAKKYRLQPVLGAREQATRAAERLLAARKKQLAEAEGELARRLGEVEACRARQAAARAEMLEAMSGGAAAARALALRTHLADLRAQEETLRAAAEEQRGAVARCEAELERARAALVEGDDLTEPIADETRSILDGHVVPTRALTNAGHYPAIDVGQPVSRVMPAAARPPHVEAARRFRELLAAYEAQKDLTPIGAYKKGTDPRTDLGIAKTDAMNACLRQGTGEKAPPATTFAQLQKMF